MDKDTEDFLAHFGVKGMRWGVRKRSAPSGQPIRVEIKPGKKIKVTGGKNQPPSEDFIRTSVTKQKIKKSGKDSVDSKELQELINRMTLESNYAKLSKKEREQNKGIIQKFIEKQVQKIL